MILQIKCLPTVLLESVPLPIVIQYNMLAKLKIWLPFLDLIYLDIYRFLTKPFQIPDLIVLIHIFYDRRLLWGHNILAKSNLQLVEDGNVLLIF